MLDTLAHSSNPYVGILTYFIAPAFLFFGLFLTGIGAWRERKKLGDSAGLLPKMVVDLSRPRDRKIMGFFIAGSLVFLLLSAVGSYHSYHFTESTQFCGQTCHTVMEPELVTYQHGPHSRVSCVQCHIGPGAEWFVKAKISGTYQVYATLFDKYPRPVPTPIKNLRPAQETCEQCHWPKKFVGNLDNVSGGVDTAYDTSQYVMPGQNITFLPNADNRRRRVFEATIESRNYNRGSFK